MALLGTYGGADDVRILQNRILAEQAGALIPEGGGEEVINYIKPAPSSPAGISLVEDAVPGEWVVNLTSLDTLVFDKSITKVDLEYWISSVGGETGNNTLFLTIEDINTGDLVEKTTFNTKDHPDLIRPCVVYGKVLYNHPDDAQPATSVVTPFYTQGKAIPSIVVRVATTRSTKKATTA